MRFSLALMLAIPLFAQPVKTLEIPTVNANAPSVDPAKVVLQIGDIKITAGQLDSLIDVYPINQQLYFRGPGKQQFADTVVRMIVLAEEARKRKLDETEKFKDQRRFSEANILAGAVTERLNSKYKPDDAALQKFYDEHRCEYQTWKVRQIVVRGPGSPMPLKPGETERTEAEALARAQELRQHLANGADFAALAHTDSDDTGTAVNGGDMGQIRHGQVVPTLEDAICKMYVGQLSEPVKTNFGYHLIKLEVKDVKGFDEVKAEIQDRTRPDAVKKRIESIIAATPVLKDPEYYGPEKQEPAKEVNYTPVKK